MDTRLWTFDDIKDATARHEALRNSDDPLRHYFYGIALEMSGQAEEADEKYMAFRMAVLRKFGDLERGAAHYMAEREAFASDERRAEHAENMVKILRGPEPGAKDSKRGNCSIT